MLAKECLAEFRLDCTLRRLTPRTVSGYYNTNKLCLDFLEGEFGLKELQLIKPTHLKVYFQMLIQKGLKPSYINGVLKAMRAFFKYAVEEGYISDNPVLKVRWQREGKVLINTFTDEEVRRLIGAFDGKSYLSMRNKLILAVAFDTGARNSEICSIATSDIRDNVILLHGKGNKERHVPLTPYVKKLMIKYERMKDAYFFDNTLKDGRYFLSRTGRMLTKEALEHIFTQANERANVRTNIRCSPHTARHYYAQTNLKNGLDVYSLSRLLGHENINITKRYLQSMQDESIVTLAAKSSPLTNLKL